MLPFLTDHLKEAVILALGLVVGFAMNINVSINNQTKARSVETQPVAAEVCWRPQTTIKLIETVAPGHDQVVPGKRYEARYQDANVRYDITWRPDSEAVAVEMLKGATFSAHAEQLNSDQMAACVVSKRVEVIKEAD